VTKLIVDLSTAFLQLFHGFGTRFAQIFTIPMFSIPILINFFV